MRLYITLCRRYNSSIGKSEPEVVPMAGEYYRWLARDVKPEEKREPTREEKIKNWWYYHKWHVLVAIVMLLVVGDIAGDIITEVRNRPDYSFAYVGSSSLPEETVTQLTEALAQLGEDLNGNGKVQVALHQYIVYPQEGEQATGKPYTMLQGAQVQLAADITNCESFFFLMENPQKFHADYEILATSEGMEAQFYAWRDCPALMELPLGGFTLETANKIYSGMSQELLSRLYIGKRDFWEGEACENQEGCEALWKKLVQGAAD